MRHHHHFHLFGLTAIAAATAALVAACGGDDNPEPQATTITGVVATGGALAEATVTVVDSDTATTDPQPVKADANGRFTVDVSGLKAPLVIKASGTVEGTPTDLIAVVPALAAESANTTNVTPLTNAVAALLAPGGAPAALLTPATLAASASTQKVADASALLVNTLKTDSGIAAALGTGFDPLSTPFNADGTGIDAVLDKLAVEVMPSGVAITNLSAPVSEGSVPTAVTLTPAQTSTPNVVPTLPASSASGDTPTAAELAALGAKIEACYALPIAQRVTVDGAGVATAVSETCAFASSDFKSDGRTFVEQVGQYTLTKTYVTGAKAGRGLVALALAPAHETDAKVWKHPYCNDAPCVVARYPFTTPSGQTFSSDWLLAKAGGGWVFVGNQRPYRTFVEPRLNRYTASNRDGAASDNYYFKDRFESQIRLLFDLSVGSTSNVRAVRFSGPGLPAGGIVQYRSQRCGTEDRMAIRNQTGDTHDIANPNAFQFWTGNSGTDFVLDAANLDGTALAMPVPNTQNNANIGFSPTPIADQATLIPAWTRYKVEIFHFDVLSNEPDEVLYVRVNSAAENAAAGVSKSWPTLADSFVADYLTPTGAKAGEVASFAQTIGWSMPGGGYVGSAYLFSSNFANATNAQNETASYGLRTRIDFEPAAFGDLSANGWRFAEVVAGTSLSSYTQNAGTNPNPRCTSQSLAPLTSNASDYREAGLSFRSTDRKLYNTIWFWDN